MVLLIDEVDRADEALEAVLLELLAEYQVSVPELGTFRAAHEPYVVLTSNNTRDLSAALKRRCLHLTLDYPDAERELAIIQSKDTGLPDALARALIEVVRGLRELDLRKAPSISETIDWARTLAVLGATELTADLLAQTANVVVKYDRDLRRTLEVLPKLVDPNAVLPSAAPGHGVMAARARPMGTTTRTGTTTSARAVGTGGQGRARTARRGLLRVTRHQPETPAGGQEPGRTVVQRPRCPPPAGLRRRVVEEAIHRFVRLLRRAGVRVGVSEALDAMRALSTPGIAADRELTRDALRVSLIKDRRDEAHLRPDLRPVLPAPPGR